MSWTVPKDSCRQLVCGYGPCDMPQGHYGHCHYMGAIGTYEHKTRIIALREDGSVDYDHTRQGCGFAFEPRDPETEAAEARRMLPFAEEQLAKAQADVDELRRKARDGE